MQFAFPMVIAIIIFGFTPTANVKADEKTETNVWTTMFGASVTKSVAPEMGKKVNLGLGVYAYTPTWGKSHIIVPVDQEVTLIKATQSGANRTYVLLIKDEDPTLLGIVGYGEYHYISITGKVKKGEFHDPKEIHSLLTSGPGVAVITLKP